MNWILLASVSAFLLSVLRVSTPLLLASMAGLLSERSGVVQIALEGLMLIGALFGAVVAWWTHSSWLGWCAAGFAGTGLALLQALFILEFRADPIVTGTAINILAAGTAPFISKLVFQTTGTTPALALEDRFTLAPMIIALLVVAMMSWWYHKTQGGLLLQFAGEEPEALRVAGHSVRRIRWQALAMSGFLAGLGGGSLSLFLASSYSPNMTAGRGFMALAALIFGRWRPRAAAAACLFFGALDAVQIRLQGSESSFLPVQIIQILPYLVTIIALAGFFGQSRPPKALGHQ